MDVAKGTVTLGTFPRKYNSSTQDQIIPRKRVTNFVVRCAKTTTLDPNFSRTVLIRHPELDTYNDYVIRPYLNNAYLLDGFYVLRRIVSGDQQRILVMNVSDKPVVISKDIRLGLIENAKTP